MKRLSWVLLLVLLCEICAAQTTLSGREFKHSTFQVLGYGGLSTDSSTPLLQSQQVKCPVEAGRGCIFYIDVHVSTTMSAGIGFLTCNCDGANVVNNTNLTYSWEQIGTDVPFTASYAFVMLVTNKRPHQTHKVELDLGCTGLDGGSGCFISAGDTSRYDLAATVRTDVFVP